jgi:hypothetical protein
MPGSQSCCLALPHPRSLPRTVFCFHNASTRVGLYAISSMLLRRFWAGMRFLILAPDDAVVRPVDSKTILPRNHEFHENLYEKSVRLNRLFNHL